MALARPPKLQQRPKLRHGSFSATLDTAAPAKYRLIVEAHGHSGPLWTRPAPSLVCYKQESQ